MYYWQSISILKTISNELWHKVCRKDIQNDHVQCSNLKKTEQTSEKPTCSSAYGAVILFRLRVVGIHASLSKPRPFENSLVQGMNNKAFKMATFRAGFWKKRKLITEKADVELVVWCGLSYELSNEHYNVRTDRDGQTDGRTLFSNAGPKAFLMIFDTNHSPEKTTALRVCGDIIITCTRCCYFVPVMLVQVSASPWDGPAGGVGTSCAARGNTPQGAWTCRICRTRWSPALWPCSPLRPDREQGVGTGKTNWAHRASRA